MLGTKFLQNTNRKPYPVYRMVPLSMIMMTSNPDFKVTTFYKSTVIKTARLKDKVTVAQEETMPNIWNATVW